jgi:hypothetical protein
MLEVVCRNGAVLLSSDDESDRVLVEPVVAAFLPAKNLRCSCGANLKPWCHQLTTEQVEIVCGSCHQTLGSLYIAARARR